MEVRRHGVLREAGKAGFSVESHRHQTAKRIVIRRKRKAQLVFEFVVAAVLFFGILLYVLNYLSGAVYGYSSDFRSDYRESKASQIGELLVLNRGMWSGQSPAVVGVAEEWPVLNSTKISWLNSSCNSNYYEFKRKLGVDRPGDNVTIVVSEILPSGSASVKAECRWGVPVPGNVSKAETRRYALLDSGNMASVYVCVWSSGK